MPARDLRNSFTEKFRELQEAGVSREQLNQYLEEHSPYQAQHLGDAGNAEIHCGQAAGLIQDIPPVAKLVKSIIADLKKRFAALEEQIRMFG
jgi:enoyl-[acyl-carrier protein] reductase II